MTPADAAGIMALCYTALLTLCAGCLMKLYREAQPFEGACNGTGLARSRPSGPGVVHSGGLSGLSHRSQKLCSVGAKCSGCSSPTGAGASGSDRRGSQPENWRSRCPLRRLCAVPLSFFFFLILAGLRRASHGGQAVGYFAADTRPDTFDALFVRDFSFAALLEVCVPVSSMSVCVHGATAPYFGSLLGHFISEKYTKLACLISAFYFVREVSDLSLLPVLTDLQRRDTQGVTTGFKPNLPVRGLWCVGSDCTPRRSSCTPSIRAVSVTKHSNKTDTIRERRCSHLPRVSFMAISWRTRAPF